jgi:hypothetical protein
LEKESAKTAFSQGCYNQVKKGKWPMDQISTDREQFLALVRQWHAGHAREDQVEHCVNVADLLVRALDLEPAPVAARHDMVLAALGHDLYEDSDIERADVARDFGNQVDKLIQALTEEKDGVGPYVERVAAGPEEARLIKLCDGADNYGGLVEKKLVYENPAKWVNKVRKHMEPMFSRLGSIPFRKYPAAGAWLSGLLAKKREGFWMVVEELVGRLARPTGKPL